jgi:hypothetical protein
MAGDDQLGKLGYASSGTVRLVRDSLHGGGEPATGPA